VYFLATAMPIAFVLTEAFLHLLRMPDAFVPRVIALVSVQLTAYDYIKQKATENGIDGIKNHFLSSALAAGMNRVLLLRV
jgi:hypothetical protein